MTVTIEFSQTLSSSAGTWIVLCKQDGDTVSYLSDTFFTKDVKFQLDGVLSAQSGDAFQGKIGQSVSAYVTHSGLQHVILIGVGDVSTLDASTAEDIGGHIYSALASASVKQSYLLADGLPHGEAVLLGLSMRSYTFDRYKTQKKSDANKAMGVTYVAENHKSVDEDFAAYKATLSGVFLARDLVNEAPNVLYPESYADRIKAELEPLGVKVDILDEKKMLKLGMGAIMAVGQGSERQPRMVVMRWKGKSVPKDKQPIALVGKGVTFDTGGISIKPAAGMDEMKMDMGGSAAVVGAMKTIASRKADSYVVGIVGLAENMPSHNAYRPGDIVTSYSGKTIEVLNTDAEGRLVLADALTYVQEKYNPSTVIDLATLTGAILVALGNEYCGTFANEDVLWEELFAASKNANEKLWRMPLDEVWSKEMVSDVADLRNIGKSRFAGSSTAAEFLNHFIDDGRKWAHMDIAGTAWIKSNRPTVPKYGVGFGVRTLDQLVQNFYETA